MKTIITKKEYTMIVGLMELARQSYRRMRECEEAYGKIIKMKENLGSYGHFSDEIFGDGDIDKALENEGIKIK